MAVHPLDDLTLAETNAARDTILKHHPDEVISFREIFLEEPSKKELSVYLDAEHAGQTSQPPHRRAQVQYDVIGSDRIPVFHDAIVDLTDGKRIAYEIVAKDQHAMVTMAEFVNFVEVCKNSQLFKDTLAEYSLPEGFEVVIEPWPYGGLLPEEENLRYFQGLCFAADTKNQNADTNFYCFPLPFIPVMDAHKNEIIRVDRLATGGKGDSMEPTKHNKNPIDHCKAEDYVPELLPSGTREELKPLNVLQPDGPSFTVDGSLVKWQGWSFRVSFNPREGAVLHDVRFGGRSIMYRLSVSEMTVPYADARYPFARKQAFDFGDGGAGNFANNLGLGCDCLGVIKYFDGVTTDSAGTAQVAPNVVCLHEQDNGIGWKHTNWRTGRAVVTRNRELVVQYILTLANYEYVFAYKFDLAGGITVETRATGIVSVVNIDPDKTSPYGNVVGPGALAQNHQHIFCVRIDPAIDGHENTVVVEESHRVPTNPTTNPRGNYYEVVQKPITKSTYLDAAADLNRTIKLTNPNKLNPISQKPVAYKFQPSSSQLLLADPDSIQARRAQFAQHHIWITKHQDRELYAAGRFTMQSARETGGVADMIARNDDVENTDVVVWNVFGLTHNPRVEDWPVMPVEIHQLVIKPADFFERNPAIDVPSVKNEASRLVEHRPNTHTNGHANGNGNANGVGSTNGTTTTNGSGGQCCS